MQEIEQNYYRLLSEFTYRLFKEKNSSYLSQIISETHLPESVLDQWLKLDFMCQPTRKISRLANYDIDIQKLRKSYKAIHNTVYAQLSSPEALRQLEISCLSALEIR